MSVTLTRSTERRNKWMEVWDLVLACISRASVLTLERDDSAPTKASSLLTLKLLLDSGSWILGLSFEVMGAVSLPLPIQLKLFATLSKQLHPRACYYFLCLWRCTTQWQQHSFMLDFRTWAKFHTVMGLSWESAYLAGDHMQEVFPKASGFFLEAFICVGGAHAV